MKEITAAVVLLSLCQMGYTMEFHVLAKERRVQSPGTIEIVFELTEIPKGYQVRLSLDARVDWPGLAGSNPWMVVAINGKNLLPPDLINKPLEFTMRCGMDTTWARGALWRICYSPDFSDALRTRPVPYGIPDADPYRFVWDITKHARPGKNTFRCQHTRLLTKGYTLVLWNISVEVGKPVQPMSARTIKPAPVGPVPTYVANGRRPVSMDVRLGAGGVIRLKVANRTFDLNSRTSEPKGKWVATTAGTWTSIVQGGAAETKWAGAGYSVTRKVTVRDDHIHVADAITNTGHQLVGMIYENRLALEEKPLEIWLSGRPAFSETQESWQPAHPSAMARWKDLTLGMIAEDDVFRVHIKSFTESDAIGIADPQLGISPGKSHTLEWSIYPIPNGDYWDFINAVRRNLGGNITIPGPIVFDHAADGSNSAEFYGEWAKSRGVKIIISGQTAFKDGMLAEGTAIPLAKKWCSGRADWIRKLHASEPDIKALIYLHTQICTEPEAEKLYADSELLGANGEHLTSPYRYPVYIYLSTMENSYGKALLKTLDRMFADMDADGIYCDEMAYASSPYAYRAPWDNCTVIIDPKTHAVTGKRSSVILLQQTWKAAMVKYLRDHGKLIIGDSPAHTRTMLNLKVPRFTETASCSFIIETHLGTPWGLGNHDLEDDDRVRARMARRLLDYAGVYAVYGWGDKPEGLHFTSVTYPITPVELYPGVVLAKERILTNRSGRYGWPDGDPADVYVFDADGKRVAEPLVKEIREDDRLLTEVRMPSDHFAVLVQHAP